MYLERPLKDFIADIARRTPTPGGGSVAALVGVLGSALLEMVGNFTIGNEKFESVEPQVQDILEQLGVLTCELGSLIEDDISAYQNFSRVSVLPRKTQQEKVIRGELLQQALKKAAEVPLKTCKMSFELMEIASRLLEIGNPRLMSDVGVGVLLAEACLESAALNVEINLSSIDDQVYVKKTKSALASLSGKARISATHILRSVKDKLKVET